MSAAQDWHDLMILKSYIKKIFRPECNAGFKSLHCIARLDQDISEG